MADAILERPRPAAATGTAGEVRGEGAPGQGGHGHGRLGARADGHHHHQGAHDGCHDHGHDHGAHGGHGHHHGHDHCACEHGHAAEERELTAAPSCSWRVMGLDCPSCARETAEAVRGLPGVSDARLVYATATLELVIADGADQVAVCREVLGTVRSLGQDLELSATEADELSARRGWWARHRETLLMGASGVALAAGLVTEHLLAGEAAATPLYVAAACLGLAFIAPMAWASLRRRTADMNVLMSVAVLGALALGLAGDADTFADAAIVIFLDQVGEWLEGWSMRKTTSSIERLMELAPDLAHVVGPDGSVSDLPAAEVAVGSVVRVLPGERVALDGEVVAGASAFDEAAVTGESVPRDKGVGDAVYAGTLNAAGVVDLLVTADAGRSTLARVVAQVQGAQAAKAPYEGFVDRFAAVYTPLVVAAAAVVGLAVPALLSLVLGASAQLWHDWAYRALSLLVVACPCALVISTPVSFVSAITRAARAGVLVKGGAAFDVAAHLTSVAIDKTGTLTRGEPAVCAVVPLGDASAADVLAVAAALEASSTHPVARAVVAEARARGIDVAGATGVTETAAAGVAGSVGGVACAVGKPAFVLAGLPAADEASEASASLAARGATSLVVARASRALGVIAVADTARDEAAAAVADLRAQGIAVTMLTGDNAAAASAVARAAGVDAVAAELLPSDKLAHVRALQEEGVVAMVGDGINDAPALAAADLGVTMGAAASDTALEVADVALLGDDLAALPAFVALSRRTMGVVRANIAFAILVKAVVFALVIGGLAGMGAAVFADTGVALIVILNGMRLML